ncbi:MAG: hypothetical protein AAFU71_08110 [Cyanobacteria bacterium J06632_22]
MPLSPVQVVHLVEALPLFQDLFGVPESTLELRARVGALLNIIDGITVAPFEVETTIDQVIAAVQARAETETGRWVKTARQWLRQQSDTLTGVVSAYVQTYARRIESSELVAVATTSVAILSDGKLSPSEGRQLTQQLIQSFELDKALRQAVSPSVLALAKRVAQYRSKADIEADILSIAQSYLQKFGGLLTPELMKQVIQKGTLNLSPETLLSGDWEDLGGLDNVARTFVFKMQLLEADPLTSKTAEEIADQVHEAVERFNRSNNAIDLTSPAADDDDLSLSSVLQPRHPN